MRGSCTTYCQPPAVRRGSYHEPGGFSPWRPPRAPDRPWWVNINRGIIVMQHGRRGVLILAALCLMVVAGCADSANSNPGTDLGSGPLLAYIGQDGNLWMSRADGGGAHAVTTVTCPQSSNCFGQPAWSPDGQ